MKRIEIVDEAIVNKLFRPGKVQSVVEEFHASDSKVVRVLLGEGEYSTLSSAQASYRNAIKRLGYSMLSRTYNGNLYLIKV